MKKKRSATDQRLLKPIEIRLRHPTLAHGSDAPKEAAMANAEELWRAWVELEAKLDLLFEHYHLSRTGNDAADYRDLVRRLAPDLFRGFELVDVNAPKPYKHRRGNPVTLMQLFADVETAKLARLGKCSDAEAIRYLRDSSALWKKHSEEGLERRARDVTPPSLAELRGASAVPAHAVSAAVASERPRRAKRIHGLPTSLARPNDPRRH
jgi:hypothetical protein